MKRFIYDFCLILILLFIGISLDDSQTYTNKQNQLKQFEKKIDNEEIVEEETHFVLNQVKENHAGNLAKDTSNIIKVIADSAVTFIHSIFEMITQT